jgi:hypothetical protein
LPVGESLSIAKALLDLRILRVEGNRGGVRAAWRCFPVRGPALPAFECCHAAAIAELQQRCSPLRFA